MLTSLKLRDIGPAPSLGIELADRLNLFTGDNGLELARRDPVARGEAHGLRRPGVWGARHGHGGDGGVLLRKANPAPPATILE